MATPPDLSDPPRPAAVDDADRALADLLDLDAAAVTATIARARALASDEAGVPAEADALLSDPIPIEISSVADASAAIAAMTGSPGVAAARATREPDASPDSAPEPVSGGNGVGGPIEIDDDLEVSAADSAPASTNATVEDTSDDFADGTPPPAGLLGRDDDAPSRLRPDSDTTAVSEQPRPPTEDFLADGAQDTLAPPPATEQPTEFTPPDPAETELDASALDADEMLASGLDDLPSGQHSAAPDAEFGEDVPTNISARPHEAAMDVGNDDGAIDAAIASLADDVHVDTQESTAVQDEPPGDDFELDIDLSDDDLVAIGDDQVVRDGEDAELDPDDPASKKGFFKRIFGK